LIVLARMVQSCLASADLGLVIIRHHIIYT